MIKAFIFDFDGVLVDTNQYHFESWKIALKPFDIKFNKNIYQNIKGLSRTRSLDILIKNLAFISEKIKFDICKKKNDIFLELTKKINSNDLMYGVERFILNHQKSHRLAVASSSRNAKYILKKMNIDHLFEFIIDGNMVKKSKPNSEVFLKCSNLLNLQPHECVVFEDSKNGVLAAKNAGFITYALGDNSLLDLADVCIKDLTEYK